MDAIVNYPGTPEGFRQAKYFGLMSQSYFDMSPYPYFSLMDWKSEADGPLPHCLPLVRKCVRRGALWLFGKPITFNITENPEVCKKVEQIWAANHMEAKLTQLGIRGGLDGTTALKFSVENIGSPDARARINILSCVNQVKFFMDPMDGERVLMAREQYPFFDYIKKEWFWFREEWTENDWVQYEPIKMGKFGTYDKNPYYWIGNPSDPDSLVEWKATRKDNPFGVIPIIRIRNSNTNSSEYSSGDFWQLFHLVDRVNLTYSNMDTSNQLDSEPALLVTDGEAENDIIDRPVRPRSSIVLNTRTRESEGENPIPVKVQLLEPSGKLRGPMREYAKDIIHEIYDTVGSAFPTQEEVTNKGMLTKSVLSEIYKPLVETTLEKRKCYGQEGICKFIQTMVYGLGNINFLGFSKEKDLNDPKNLVTIDWFELFDMTAEEKFSEVDRIDQEELSGLITRETAIRKVCRLEEIEEADKVVEELKNFERAPTEANNASGRKRQQQSNRGDVTDAT